MLIVWEGASCKRKISVGPLLTALLVIIMCWSCLLPVILQCCDVAAYASLWSQELSWGMGGGGIQLRTGPTKLDRLWGGGDQSKESPGPLSWGHSVKELCLPCLTGSDEDEGGCVDTVSVPCCWGVVWCVGQMYHTSVPMMFIRLTCKPCWPTRSVRGTIIIIYNN